MLGEAEGDLEHGQLGDGSARNAARTIKKKKLKGSAHQEELKNPMLLCGSTPGTGEKSYATVPSKGSAHPEKLRSPMPL